MFEFHLSPGWSAAVIASATLALLGPVVLAVVLITAIAAAGLWFAWRAARLTEGGKGAVVSPEPVSPKEDG